MSSEKPNFLSQPVVKSVFMYRNGDPHYDARRIVINQKRVCDLETLMREVTSGIQAPFGAVRNIYTPRGGHKVDSVESLQSGEQYVAAGRERFKKLDYHQIGYRKKRMMQTLPMQAKPLPQHRIIVSARFLKPIKEPCPIFVVANGDVLNPAVRMLIHQRMLGQFDKILEMITERMGLRCLGGVRSLYTCEGHQLTDATQLESGQLYVALGRERFKKLPYSDLLFTKPRWTKRVNGMRANTLPPIYRFSKQNGNSKSMVRCSESGDGESKSPPLGRSVNNNKEHLSSIVREISQARLITFRKKRSGQSMTLGVSDNDDPESKAADGNTEDEPTEEKPAAGDAKASEESDEKAEKKEETPAENTTEEEKTSAGKEETKESEETSAQIEGKEKEENKATSTEKEGEETKEPEETSAQNESEENKENKVTSGQKEGEKQTSDQKEGDKETSNQKESEKEKENEKKREATAGQEEEGEQGSSNSNTDKSQDKKETEDGKHSSSDGVKDEREDAVEDETQDKDQGKEAENGKDPVNDVDTAEEQKEKENGDDPGKTRSDNETREDGKGRSGGSNGNQEENTSETKGDVSKESGEEERGVNGEISREEDEVESEAELEVDEKNSASPKETTENGEKGEKSKEGENSGKK